MTNDYNSTSIHPSKKPEATPRNSTLNVILQFARSYEILDGISCPSFNLN